MKKVYVDGETVLVEDQMTGDQIAQLVQCPPDHFPVISRRTDPRFEETIPVAKRNPYPMQNGDRLETLYHVDNGGKSHEEYATPAI